MIRIRSHSRRVLAFLGLALGIATAAVAAEAATVITTGADRKVKLWNTESGDLIKSVDAHEGAVTAAVLSFDGKHLATGGADKKIKLWNAADGTLIRAWDAHQGDVTAVAFSADGAQLASGGADQKVKLWKVSDGSLVRTLDHHTAKILSVFVARGLLLSSSTDGKLIVADEDGMVLIEIPTGHDGGLTANVTNLAKSVTYTGGADGKIKYWSQEASGEFAGTQGSAVTAMSVSADGAKLVTAGADGKVHVWDTGTYKQLKTVSSGHKGGATAVYLTPDGRFVITGGTDGAGKVWDPETGDLLKETEAHSGGVTAILLRAD